MTTITIQKLEFTGPAAPYSEGHVLSATEATALNQTWAENLRNNFSGKVKSLIEAGTPADQLSDLKAEFTKYAEAYSFAQRTSRAPVDPVGNEAHKLAKTAVQAALRNKGIELKTFPVAQLDDLVGKLLAKNPAYREEAERRISAQRSAADDILGMLDAEPASVEHTPEVKQPKAKKAKAEHAHTEA